MLTDGFWSWKTVGDKTAIKQTVPNHHHTNTTHIQTSKLRLPLFTRQKAFCSTGLIGVVGPVWRQVPRHRPDLPTWHGAIEWDLKIGQFFKTLVTFVQWQYIKLVKIGAIFSLFLTPRPDFRWGRCLSLTLSESWQVWNQPPGPTYYRTTVLYFNFVFSIWIFFTNLFERMMGNQQFMPQL